MNKITFRISVLLILLSFIIVTCCSCVDEKYDKKWIIGKTSSEIEERYGKFDILLNDEKDENGNYINEGCGYLTKKARTGFLGTDPDEFLIIYFDENGVAYKIKENFPRPGG